MTTIGKQCISQHCDNCMFWTEHKREGTCSQLVKTPNGLINQYTFHDHVCSIHEEDKKTLDLRLYMKPSGEVAITGSYSKDALLKAQEFIHSKLKETK